MFLNPLAINRLRKLCKDYNSKLIDLDAYTYNLWKISQEITALEEYELRNLLMESEAHLDSLLHTTEEDMLFEKTMEVVNKIERKLDSWDENAN